MNHQDCRCELLSSSEVGHVSICEGCGQVQLTLQCMTVRFEADAFGALARMVAQAHHRLEGAAIKKTVAAPLVSPGSLH